MSLSIVSILEKNYHDLDFTKVYKQLYQHWKCPVVVICNGENWLLLWNLCKATWVTWSL